MRPASVVVVDGEGMGVFHEAIVDGGGVVEMHTVGGGDVVGG